MKIKGVLDLEKPKGKLIAKTLPLWNRKYMVEVILGFVK